MGDLKVLRKRRIDKHTHAEDYESKVTSGGLDLRLSSPPTTRLFKGRLYYNTSTDKLYVYTSSGWQEVGSGGSGGATELNDLTDVTITSVADKELLQYDSGSSAWINRTYAEADLYTRTELNSTADGSEGATLIGFDDAGATYTVKDAFGVTTHSGIISPPTISVEGGLDISWTSSIIWDTNSKKMVAVSSGSGTVNDDSVTYLKWSSGTSLTLDTSPVADNEVEIGMVFAQSGDIYEIFTCPTLRTDHNKLSRGICETAPSIVVSGLTLSEDTDATNTWDVKVSPGVWYFALQKKNELTSTVYSRTNNMTRWYHSSGSWTADTNAEIDPTKWDNGTDLVSNSTRS